jgi:hypothetical protein
MQKGPGGVLFEDSEGVFVLVRGYVTILQLQVTK